ncbi:MAG: nucleotidyltransferase family protein [Gemmatimonadales bacterium]
MTEVYALLLAAGSSTRFGADKLRAELRGKAIGAHVTSTLGSAIARGVLAGGIAVVSPGNTSLETGRLTRVVNPDAGKGLSTSLNVGLAALSDIEPPASGALIVLADQPALRVEVIEAVVAGWRRTHRSTRPRYAAAPDEPGHPVLLDRRDWLLADRLTGDQGLRQLLAGVEVTLVDVPGANPDVDTPDDLRRLEETR